MNYLDLVGSLWWQFMNLIYPLARSTIFCKVNNWIALYTTRCSQPVELHSHHTYRFSEPKQHFSSAIRIQAVQSTFNFDDLSCKLPSLKISHLAIWTPQAPLRLSLPHCFLVYTSGRYNLELHGGSSEAGYHPVYECIHAWYQCVQLKARSLKNKMKMI